MEGQVLVRRLNLIPCDLQAAVVEEEALYLKPVQEVEVSSMEVAGVQPSLEGEGGAFGTPLGAVAEAAFEKDLEARVAHPTVQKVVVGEACC